MATTMDRLNEQVSAAIKAAERMKNKRSAKAKAAFAEVSKAEERIANVTQPFSEEGMIARRGAVRAAIQSGDTKRAKNLVAVYANESHVPDAFLTELKAMVEKT